MGLLRCDRNDEAMDSRFSGNDKRDLGNHIGLPLQSCGFTEFTDHIGFLPGEVGSISTKMAAIRGFGKNGAGEF
jgi:hypothetical protein